MSDTESGYRTLCGRPLTWNESDTLKAWVCHNCPGTPSEALDVEACVPNTKLRASGKWIPVARKYVQKQPISDADFARIMAAEDRRIRRAVKRALLVKDDGD